VIEGHRASACLGTTEKRVGPKRVRCWPPPADVTSVMLMLGRHHRAVSTSSMVTPHVSAGTPRFAA
jgi:hypothetical protein